MEIKFYRYDYDDPYVMLAHSILATHTHSDLVRILEDKDYIKRLVQKETRLQDFSGAFVDCIIQSILEDKRRMELMHQLDKLAEYFANNLDIERLRGELLKYGNKYNII